MRTHLQAAERNAHILEMAGEAAASLPARGAEAAQNNQESV
jgi:hypothetical protein